MFFLDSENIGMGKCQTIFANFQWVSQFAYGHIKDIMWYWQNTKYYDVFF